MSSFKNIIFTSIRKLLRNPFFETILYSLAKKQSLNRLISKIAPGNTLYKNGAVRKAKREGINYVLDISDYQHWLIYFGITIDNPIGLFELIKKGDTLIDIGVNIGQTAMMFSKLGGEKATIYGFEPDLINYSIAVENLKQNSFKNITYFNIGLGSKNEALPLKINSPSNRGGNRIDKNDSSNSSIVSIETLDAIFKKENITKIDVIKIDVEGYELEVIKGANQTLKKYFPNLFIEVDNYNLQQQGTSAKELINYISDLGYTVTNAKNKQHIKSDENFNNCHFDIICKK
jgi:FkbM family methyltransferase